MFPDLINDSIEISELPTSFLDVQLNSLETVEEGNTCESSDSSLYEKLKAKIIK